MRTWIRRTIFLAAWTALIGASTYVAVGRVSERRREKQDSLGPSVAALDLYEPANAELARSPAERLATQEPNANVIDQDVINEIVSIRNRLREMSNGIPIPAADCDQDFAISLREVMSQPRPEIGTAQRDKLLDETRSVAQRETECEAAAQAIPAVDLTLRAITVGTSHELDAPLPVPSLDPLLAPPPPSFRAPRLNLPTYSSGTATVSSRSDVVVVLRQMSRQFDHLAADLEDQREFDDAESLRELVRTVRAEARRLEEQPKALAAGTDHGESSAPDLEPFRSN